MKLLGIIIAVIISALTGNYYAVRLGRRLELLKKLEYMLEKMEILIRCRSATVYEMIRELSRDKRLEELEFLKYIDVGGENITFHEMWERGVNDFRSACLKSEDIDLLINIGAELGTSDTQGQLESLAMSRASLSLMIKESQEEYAKKASLYRSMGVLAGALVAVLLI